METCTIRRSPTARAASQTLSVPSTLTRSSASRPLRPAEIRNKDGWYNKERQYYSRNRVENAVVKDGTLRITARLESLRDAPDWGGQPYTSARMLTRGKAAWTYGFFEVRAKLPCGKGTWPATL